MYALVDKLARGLALLGGTVLSILIIMTCLSVAGRSIPGVGPINGDFELVEAGMAFAIFAFLPLCQLNGAHASVDIFTAKLPPRVNRFLQMTIDLVFAAVLVLIAVQLYGGMASKLRSGQTTLLLEFPVWWAYAASLLGAAVAALVSVYIAIMRILEVATGRGHLPAGMEADH